MHQLIRGERLTFMKLSTFILCLLSIGVGWAVVSAQLRADPPAVQRLVTVTTGEVNGEAAKGQVSLKGFPDKIALSGPGSQAHVIFQQVTSGEVGSEIREGLQVRVANEDIASYADGQVVAKKQGQTELVVSWKHGDETLETKLPLSVQNEGSQTWEFEAHVQSVLTRAACNSGACHGALAGKGGFKLSLRAYDSLSDHFNITRQDRGRRVDAANPGRSLLLAKPTGMIAHKGGIRLDAESHDYRILADWIASGAPGRQTDDPSLVKIEMLPEQINLAQDARQQLIVLAHYSNGRVEDVTHWAKFSSANEAMAQVDTDGRVHIVGHGKGSIVGSFASRIAITSIVSAYSNEVPASAYAEFQPANFIDQLLLEEWQRLHLVPSSGCSDETFLRRAYLDTTGALPTPEQVRSFLGDTRADRRPRLVEELLASDGFVDYWSYKWSDLLLINGTLLRPDAVATFYKWVRQNVQNNTPWDEMARQIVLARGDSMEQGATNFYAIHQDPETLTENTCQAFLSLSIACAKCHNHPLEKWTNDQYYSMANLYARVRAKGWGGDARNGDGKRTLVVLDQGDLIQPSRGKPQPPAPLDSAPIDADSTQDRREALAAWLTSRDNPYFARAIANRVWANFMGPGLVEAVDDMRASNPASSEKLLTALAKHLGDTNFDLKGLMRLILNSKAYQRSCDALPGNANDQRMYCRHLPRRLMAEVLHDAVCQVTSVPTKFTEIEFSGADKQKTEIYKEGTHSLQLHDSAVANYFLKTFGRHQRRITCDCERSDQPTVVQVLHLSNGDTLNSKLSDSRSIVSRWIADAKPIEDIIEESYLLALSRFPSAAERKELVRVTEAELAEGSDRRSVLEDMLWSLMTSPEFLFTH